MAGAIPAGISDTTWRLTGAPGARGHIRRADSIAIHAAVGERRQIVSGADVLSQDAAQSVANENHLGREAVKICQDSTKRFVYRKHGM
jgi:hypothetical protein